MIRKSIEQAGDYAVDMIMETKRVVYFLGDTFSGIVEAFMHPRKIRWKETLHYMELCGSGALSIVTLIGFLMGLIMGFQGALLLHRYGTDVLIADMVGISMCKELGPLMVAMIASGRAGSAFAAEIGTMKVSEEVNALVTMGFDPQRFLVIPKLIAMCICMPILALFSDLAGIIGGLSVSTFQLGLPVSVYCQRIVTVVKMDYLVEGLTKCFVYGILITLVGCLRGLNAQDDAQGVGKAATTTVVNSILMITIANAFLTYLFILFD